MHIAFLIDKLGMGGTERQLVLWANRIHERRLARVSIVCLMSVGSLAAEVAPGIPIIDLGLRRVYGLQAMRALFGLRRWCLAERVDLVQSLLTSANNFASLLGPLARVHTVASRRDVGIYPGFWWQKIEEKWAYRVVDSVICVSEAVRAQLLRNDPGLAGKLSVIPNAVDVDAADRLVRDAAPVESGPPYVVTVGRITPVKAYDFLLDAASRIDGRLVVVGGGPDLERLRRAVEERALGDRLEFVGEKTLADTAALVRNAAFAVHPSYSEGMSNAILEYMVYGKAVVCRDLESNRELITQGQSGFLFRDADQFIESVNRLVHSAELRSAMGLAARRRIVGQHELDMILDSYMDRYRQLVGPDG